MRNLYTRYRYIIHTFYVEFNHFLWDFHKKKEVQSNRDGITLCVIVSLELNFLFCYKPTAGLKVKKRDSFLKSLSFNVKARDVAGVQWTPFCYDRGASRDLELRATAGLEAKKSDSFWNHSFLI